MASTDDHAVHRPRVDIAAVSHPGARQHLQDAYASSHSSDGTYFVVAVADGLGWASRSGEIAQAAVDAAVAFGSRLDHYQDDPAQLIELVRVTVALHAAYATGPQREAFEDFEFGAADGRRPDTCLVVATVDVAGDVHVGWVGDCRAWLHLDDGRLIQLTRDHNLAEFGRPHELTRCLGEGRPESGHWHAGTRPDWRPRHLVLTTDGVHQPLSREVITHALITAPTARRAARWLTRWAVRASGVGADDATALVVAFRTVHDTSR